MSISSAVLAWISKLMVVGDSMGPGLQLIRAHFLNFHLGKLSREFKLRRKSTFHKIPMAIFGSAWYCSCSHMVWHAGSPTRIACVDVTLTGSNVKVKVTDHLNFRQLPITAHFYVYLLRDFRLELRTVSDSMEPDLQLVGARFSNLLLGKLWQEFKLHRMSIFHEIQMAIFR